MAEDSSNDGGLPPKLNLRKIVSTPTEQAPQPAADSASSAPKTVAATEPVVANTPTAAPTTEAGSSASSGTMRIKLPDEPSAGNPPSSAESKPTPPTPILKKPVSLEQAATATAKAETAANPPTSASADETAPAKPAVRPTLAPKTIKLKKPVPIGIKRPSVDASAPVGSKRSTSKISLPIDSDSEKPDTPQAPKPIKIAKTSPIPVVTDDHAPKPVATPVAPQPAPDPKRQTSRISLESAFGSENNANQPKTIKLKRPGSTTGKVQGISAPTAGATRESTAPTVSPDDDGETPDTQKKTIKVKRPSGARPKLRTSASKSSSGAGGTSGSDSVSATMFAPPPTAAVASDSAHWFFIVTSCAATIIIGVLIYVLCAQTFGPNISLTQLSYGAPNAELPWPGRIER